MKKAICLAAQGLDSVVDPFYSARENWQGGMGDNFFKMMVQKFGEPGKVTVLSCHTSIDDLDDFPRHFDFTGGFIGVNQHFFDQIRSEKQLVWLQNGVISLLVAAFRGRRVNREQRGYLLLLRRYAGSCGILAGEGFSSGSRIYQEPFNAR